MRSARSSSLAVCAPAMRISLDRLCRRADAGRDLVFVPTSSPSPDFYGGKRKGYNLYANSSVRSLSINTLAYRSPGSLDVFSRYGFATHKIIGCRNAQTTKAPHPCR
jgi:hypothetical protein